MIETAGELMIEMPKILNNFYTYHIPISVDGKSIKRCILEQNDDGKPFILIETKQ